MTRRSIAICIFWSGVALGTSTPLTAAPRCQNIAQDQDQATTHDGNSSPPDAGATPAQTNPNKPKANPKPAAQSDHSPTRLETYKTIGNVELKLHIFEPAGHKATDQKPVAVFFFGGGWSNGNPKQFYGQCDYLAGRGMVAISAEYRIKSRHNTPPTACVKDGKSAIRWIREHAAELGIDPNQVIAGGGSAGGHVAAATGTGTAFDDEPESETDCRPQALVLFNPVFDNGPDGFGYGRVKAYWQQISPMHNIDEKTPPTIVFLGTKDKLIPVATAKKYKKRMQQRKSRCKLVLYEGQEHAFFNYRNGGDKQKNKFFRKTMTETDAFLTSLGYLEPHHRQLRMNPTPTPSTTPSDRTDHQPTRPAE